MDRVSRALFLRSSALGEWPLIEAGLPDLMAFQYREDFGFRLVPHYFRRDVRQLGAVRTLLVDLEPHRDWKIDLCMSFAPAFFRGCPSLKSAERSLRDVEALDFRDGGATVPAFWEALREECRPMLSTVEIVDLGGRGSDGSDRALRGVGRISQRLFGETRFPGASLNRSIGHIRTRPVPAGD